MSNVEYVGDVLLVTQEATHYNTEYADTSTETKCIIVRGKNTVTGERQVAYSVFEKKPNGDRTTIMFGESGSEAKQKFRNIINELIG